MASTVLPNGIIIPEKFSRDWYADLYHNWQELDNLLGGGTPKDGTLTIQKNGDTVGTFSANQATDETINIEVPTATSELTNDSGFITGVSWNDVSDKPTFATVATSGSYNDLSNKPTIPTVNNATLTIQKNETTIDTFTANSSSDKTVNIQCVDLTSNQTVGGIKTFSNAPVVGSISLDGKTIDTDANGNMTYDSHIVDTIEEQGEGYIRYSNGIQICWGSISIQSACSSPWGSLFETNVMMVGSYTRSFVENPAVSISGSIGVFAAIIETIGGNTTTTPQIWLCRATATNDTVTCIAHYIAIGCWK